MNTNIIYFVIVLVIICMLYYQSFNMLLTSNVIILLLLMTIIYNNKMEFFTSPADIDSSALGEIASVYNTDPLTVNNLTVTNSANLKNLNANGGVNAQNINTSTISSSSSSVPLSLQGNVNISGDETVHILNTTKLNAQTINTADLTVSNAASINNATYSGDQIIANNLGALKLTSSGPAYYPVTGPGANKWWSFVGQPIN